MFIHPFSLQQWTLQLLKESFVCLEIIYFVYLAICRRFLAC